MLKAELILVSDIYSGNILDDHQGALEAFSK